MSLLNMVNTSCWVDDCGNVCEGQYKMMYIFDKMVPVLHGRGTLNKSKGIKYEGYFIEGIRHGPFQVTDMMKQETVRVLYDHGFIRTDINIEK